MSTTAYTTIVKVSPDTALNLAELVCLFVSARKSEEGRALFAKCEGHINGAETLALLNLLVDQTDDILAVEKESDAEGCFQALVPILFTMDAASQAQVVTRLIAQLTQSTTALATGEESKARLRLQILLTIFNLMVAAELKYSLLIAILSYSVKTKQSAAVARYHDRVDVWVSSWSLSPQQARALYLGMSEALGAGSKALLLQVKYFDSFEADAEPTEIVPLATAALLSAINSPVGSYKDRSALLQSLSKHSSEAPLRPLIELLTILCKGSLEDFNSFRQANAEVLRVHGISPETIERSLRLLCLSSLAETEPILTYSRVAEALKVDRAEVELWVVEAISGGLMDATIDQLPETITVSRCIHRSFGKEQWVSIQQKLAVWRRNIAGLIETTNRHEGVRATASKAV